MRLSLKGVVILVSTAAAIAQSQQEGSRPGWPCVPGRAVDPSYIDISESTGGLLFFSQKGEAAHGGSLLGAIYTHKATLFRAVGQITGVRDFEFPVDMTVRSLFVAVSMQCRQSIAVVDPAGAETTPANAVLSQDLQTGKLVRVDAPSVGKWRVHVSGQGLVVLIVLADTDVRLHDVRAVEPPLRVGKTQKVRVSFDDEITDPRFSLLDSIGETIGTASHAESTDAEFILDIAPNTERFRIACDGLDETGHPLRRVHPLLFRAN